MTFWNCCSMPLICCWRRLFLSCLSLATDGSFLRAGGECSLLILSRLAMRTGLSSSIRSAKPILCSGSHFSIFFRRLVNYGEYLPLASLSWLSIFYSSTSRLSMSALSEDRAASGEMQSAESKHIFRARRPTQKMSPLPSSSWGSSNPSLSWVMCSGGRQTSLQAAFLTSCLLVRARAIW